MRGCEQKLRVYPNLTQKSLRGFGEAALSARFLINKHNRALHRTVGPDQRLRKLTLIVSVAPKSFTYQSRLAIEVQAAMACLCGYILCCRKASSQCFKSRWRLPLCILSTHLKSRGKGMGAFYTPSWLQSQAGPDEAGAWRALEPRRGCWNELCCNQVELKVTKHPSHNAEWRILHVTLSV